MSASRKSSNREAVRMLPDLVACAGDLEEIAIHMEGAARALRQMHQEGFRLVEDPCREVIRVSAPSAALARRWGLDHCANAILPIATL